MPRPTPEKPDLAEKGRTASLDRRLFMQLLVFGGCGYVQPMIEVLKGSALQTVLYEDVNDPRGIGLLTITEEPADFTGALRRLLNDKPFDSLTLKPQYTMLGRTYSLGYEPDLEETLLRRPVRHACNPDWPWAVWYPLRRSGAFMKVPPQEQGAMLREHGEIGMSFGAHDLAHDIRLDCHGLDLNDNDFVLGLTGKELFPLSALVQAMRKTEHTAQYLERLGPFFVGRTVWQSPISAAES